MPRPDVIEALKELDPGQRALLDLSLNRELSDSLIAGLLENVDESGVAGMRSEALAALARAAEIEGPEAAGEVERQLRSASDQQWLGVEEEANGNRKGSATGHPRVHADGSGVVATVPSGAPRAAAPPRRPQAARPSATEKPDRSRRGWAVAFALLALAGVVSIIIALAGGDEGGSDSASEPRDAATTGQATGEGSTGTGEGNTGGGEGNAGEGAPAPPAEPVQLEALTPGAVAGGASIAPAADGEGLVLRLSGMPDPDGYYRLWLYDSLIESAPVAGIASGSGAVRFELPADAADFESLDLSVEDSPADSTHSGSSVFRIPLSAID